MQSYTRGDGCCLGADFWGDVGEHQFADVAGGRQPGGEAVAHVACADDQDPCHRPNLAVSDVVPDYRVTPLS